MRQTLYEPERIYIGDNPPKRIIIQQNKTKFIQSITIKKIPDAECVEHWFHDTLELSTDLVAIIGNKGSGKSALADILGLLGNTHVSQKYFSFLHPEQFCRPNERKANDFQATLTWQSSHTNKCLLSDRPENQISEYVRYIPQNYFEVICNEVLEKEKGSFDRELKKVIYSHVATSDKLGKDSLDELVQYRTQETDDAIYQLKRELSSINDVIVEIETELRPDYRRSLESKLQKKQAELRSLEFEKPEEIRFPENASVESQQITEEINQTTQEINKIDIEIEKISTKADTLAQNLAAIELLKEKIENFQDYLTGFQSDCKELLLDTDISLENIIQISINLEPVTNLIKSLSMQKAQAFDFLST